MKYYIARVKDHIKKGQLVYYNPNTHEIMNMGKSNRNRWEKAIKEKRCKQFRNNIKSMEG